MSYLFFAAVFDAFCDFVFSLHPEIISRPTFDFCLFSTLSAKWTKPGPIYIYYIILYYILFYFIILYYIILYYIILYYIILYYFILYHIILYYIYIILYYIIFMGNPCSMPVAM